MQHYYIEVEKDKAPQFARRISELGLTRHINLKQSMWGARENAVFIVRHYDHTRLPEDLQEMIETVKYQP